MKYNYITHNSLLQKSINNEGFFRGYAAIFKIKDSHNDIILEGAFKESISVNPDVKLLWQHEQKQPIGTIHSLAEDDFGLIVEGRLLMSLQKAREAYSMITSGIIKGMSIGYTIDDHFIDAGVRYLSKITLHEISLVTFPANRHAKINYIKSTDSQDEGLLNAFDRANNALLGLKSAP